MKTRTEIDYNMLEDVNGGVAPRRHQVTEIRKSPEKNTFFNIIRKKNGANLGTSRRTISGPVVTNDSAENHVILNYSYMSVL